MKNLHKIKALESEFLNKAYAAYFATSGQYLIGYKHGNYYLMRNISDKTPTLIVWKENLWEALIKNWHEIGSPTYPNQVVKL